LISFKLNPNNSLKIFLPLPNQVKNSGSLFEGKNK